MLLNNEQELIYELFLCVYMPVKVRNRDAFKISIIIIYQWSKYSFSCVLLVESVSREIDEIRLSPLHQRARQTMHYSPVNNKKNHVRHHGNTRPLDSRKPRMFCE